MIEDYLDPDPRRSSTAHDFVLVNELLLTVPLATGAYWARPEKAIRQPILVSLKVPYDVGRAAANDDLTHSINYTTLSKVLRDAVVSQESFGSLEHLTNFVFETFLGPNTRFHPRLGALHVKVTQVRSPLHSKSVGLEAAASVPGGESPWRISTVSHFLEDIHSHAIVGVNRSEREEKQIVKLNVSIDTFVPDLSEPNWLDYRKLTQVLYDGVDKSSYLTLEALASFAAIRVLEHIHSYMPHVRSPNVTLRAAKPSALVFANSAEIEVQRSYHHYPDTFHHIHRIGSMVAPVVEVAAAPVSAVSAAKTEEPSAFIPLHISAIALGSNVGDSCRNIELALRLLEKPREVLPLSSEDMSVDILDTSFLYQTSPMYLTDQPPFFNCACLIETNLAPDYLLKLMKGIEAAVGRVPSTRNGPRAVDLDIIFYGDASIDTRPLHARESLDDLEGHLIVPHPRLCEREFVLRPLNDMIPGYAHPRYRKTIGQLLADLPSFDPSMRRVIPFPRLPLSADYPWKFSSIPPVPPTLTYWTFSAVSPKDRMRKPDEKQKCHLMATLNVTPDSFSDGSKHNTLEKAMGYARESAQTGAGILDIGGYSTRPGAEFVSAQEEIDRVVPVVEEIRKTVKETELDKRLADMLISVDTFRPEVAEAAILAGANCINDVYGFTGHEEWPLEEEEAKKRAAACMTSMKKIARQFAVPVVLMHSRGEAGKNKEYGMYSYAKDGAVLEGVRIELGDKVERVVKGKGGVRRWMVIMDPGVGFSKTVEGNLEIIRDAAKIVADVNVGQDGKKRNPLKGFPMLIGASRKSFLGAILSQGEQGRITTPVERLWATTVPVVCAVQQGSLVVRVHDTKEMADVLNIANELWG